MDVEMVTSDGWTIYNYAWLADSDKLDEERQSYLFAGVVFN